MELTKTNNGQWKPGQTGNPNGRPVGARKHFSAGFLRDLAEVWAEHGRDTMVHTAKLNPGVFFETSAWLHRGACEDAWRPSCDVDDLTMPCYLDRRPVSRA